MSSFLTRTLNASRQRIVMSPMPASRMLAAQSQRQRGFSTTMPTEKTAKETVKDSLKTVDRAVSNKLVDGIDMATAATHKVKDKAEQLSHMTSQKTHEMSGDMKSSMEGMKEDMKGMKEDMKGTKDQMKGQAKDMAEDMKAQAKEKTDKMKDSADTMKEKANDSAEGMWDKF